MADRTQEYIQLCSVISNGESSIRKPRPVSSDVKTKNAFHEATSDIAKGIHKTSTVLTKLTALIKKQGLFDDPSEEINTLIFRIKQDLDELNTKCDSAQQFIESKKTMFSSSSDANQSAKHNVNVVSTLKADLMHTTKDFKGVLELRQQKMKSQQDRKQQLTGKGLLSPHLLSDSNSKESGNGKSFSNGSDAYTSGTSRGTSNALVNRNSHFVSPYANDSSSSSSSAYANNNTDIDFESQQALLLKPMDSRYFDQREHAVTEVEKTIGELGTLFNRLSTMIAEQGAMVERIDQDVEDTVQNSNNARKVLEDMYARVSSNSGMYLKIGGIIAIFFLFFLIFLM